MNNQHTEIYTYIERQPEGLKRLLTYYSELLLRMELTTKIRYKIPFFDHYSWICYLNPIRGERVELVFLYGQELSNEHLLLQPKNRKQVAGIELSEITEVPDHHIRELVAEAMVLDEYRHQLKHKKRQN
jgi:hypothetical protein